MPSNVSKLAATYGDEDAQDAIDALLSGGPNVSLNYEDSGDELTITATDTNLTDEEVEDIVGSLIKSDSNTSVSYDDANGELTVSLSNSISVDTLEADNGLKGPTASEGDVVTLPSNPDVVPIYFDAQTGQPLVPDLEETV